ncbi:MAG: diguanylate cyclase [Candidatus Aegiribacteria sp.]|nr:diguanylate cyclase [Candidatus Aegiribacteria sp.]
MNDISSEEFRIERADNLASALDRIREHDFDVIVADLDLPDSSGDETALQICRYAMKVPLIVLTEIDDEKIELNALKAGAQDFLVKGKLEPDSIWRAIRHSIERKQMDWQLRLARRRLRILHDAGSKLETCTMKKNAFQIAIDSTKILLPDMMCQIVTEKDGILTVVATSPELNDRIGNKTNPDFGLIGMAFAKKRTFQFKSHDEIPAINPENETFRSGVSIPIGSNAVFQCVSNEPDAFTNDDTNILEMLAGHLTGTVERITLQRKLRNLAIHDPLTGVFNRNFFQTAMNREKIRAERYSTSIGFLMIDIDNFKEINDLYGHLTGDKILREVASYLIESIRESDYLIRYGGDEFLMILIETGQTASLVRDRLINGVKLAENTTHIIGSPVTLSIGHSHWNSKSAISIHETLSEADRRMYEHKRSKG